MQNTAIKRHKLTVDDYYRMGQAGILSEDERVELIEGELIDRAPVGSRHADRSPWVMTARGGLLRAGQA